MGGERDVREGVRKRGGGEIENIRFLNNDSRANKNYMKLQSTILYHNFL